jgi:CubicO group peptidase (beta-lactamase class C family)
MSGTMPRMAMLLRTMHLVATATAPAATASCNFSAHLDFAGPEGALVRGPRTQEQCCDACVRYSAQHCIAAVWVPGSAECVVKWAPSHPTRTSKSVIACIRGAIPPLPPPPPPPPGPVTPTPPPPPRQRSYWPTEGWRTSSPEAQGMDAAALDKATAFVRDFNPNGNKADAFLVVRGGFIVAESYWGSANATTIHDIASGTKSIGSMALAHAVHAGAFSADSNISHFFPDLAPLTPEAAAQPLQVKHAISMAGGTNATYWQGRDGCGPPNASQCPCLSGKKCPPTYKFSFPPGFVVGLRHGPPGAPESISRHGVLKRPGADFTYSFANPALMTGVLRRATGMSYAEYCDTHLFPKVGVRPGTWYWLGDREGDSQPDGGSFHTARNYARMAFLMLNHGQWEVNGTLTQLLDPEWVEGAAHPPPSDWSPCPFYSRFFWRKPLNSGKQLGARVPEDAYWAFGGYGQFAVVSSASLRGSLSSTRAA